MRDFTGNYWTFLVYSHHLSNLGRWMNFQNIFLTIFLLPRVFLYFIHPSSRYFTIFCWFFFRCETFLLEMLNFFMIFIKRFRLNLFLVQFSINLFIVLFLATLHCLNANTVQWFVGLENGKRLRFSISIRKGNRSAQPATLLCLVMRKRCGNFKFFSCLFLFSDKVEKCQHLRWLCSTV